MANVTITPANVVPSATNTTKHYTPATYICGEAIAAGEIVCLSAIDNKLYKADANDTDKRDVKGFAGNSAAAAGQRVDIITEAPAMAVGTHGVALATALYLSETAGKICPYADLTTGSVPILVAYTVSTTELQVVLAKCLVAKS